MSASNGLKAKQFKSERHLKYGIKTSNFKAFVWFGQSYMLRHDAVTTRLLGSYTLTFRQAILLKNSPFLIEKKIHIPKMT